MRHFEQAEFPKWSYADALKKRFGTRAGPVGAPTKGPYRKQYEIIAKRSRGKLITGVCEKNAHRNIYQYIGICVVGSKIRVGMNIIINRYIVELPRDAVAVVKPNARDI